MTRLLLIVAVGLSVAACGARTVWLKPGASYADFQRDAAECDPDMWRQGASPADSSSASPDPATSTAISGQAAANPGYQLPDKMSPTARYNACMQARGWEKNRSSGGASPPGTR
jgi:hypothetical protein